MTGWLSSSLAAGCLLLSLLPTLSSAQEAAGFDFYGHINLGILNVENGALEDRYLADNDNSTSRLGFDYTFPQTFRGSFRFTFETALGLAGSADLTAEDHEFSIDYARTELRKFELRYRSLDAGTFWAGQGSMATDGVAEADQSGTSVIMYSGISDLAGSNTFRMTNGSRSDITINDTFNAFDGGRRFRLRYDTPTFSDFTFSFAAGKEILAEDDDINVYDLAARYEKDYGGINAAGQIGLAAVEDGNRQIVGSVSVLHEASGFSVTLAGGTADDSDTSYVFTKAGLQRDIFEFGSTAFSVDYYSGRNFGVVAAGSTSVGFGLVQHISNYDTELYAGYRRNAYDRPGMSLQDIHLIALGARVSF